MMADKQVIEVKRGDDMDVYATDACIIYVQLPDGILLKLDRVAAWKLGRDIREITEKGHG